MEIPLEDLCERYKQAYTSAVTDVLDRRALRHQWLGPKIRALAPGMIVAGEAFTVQWASIPSSPGTPSPKTGEMLDALYPHCVVVMDTARNPEVGYWGELCCNYCLKSDVAGAVVDGGIRDSDYILALDFPIFGRFTTPIEATTRSQIISFQEPIRIHDVDIYPGDFVFGDMGGIVIVPKAIVEDVLQEVENIVQRESRMRRELREGVRAGEVLKKYRSF